MVDRSFSFGEINTSALKIQLNKVREELRQISSKLDENEPPDFFMALLNYETELSDIIKSVEDSNSSHIENDFNVNDTKNIVIGKSQVEQDYEMAILLSGRFSYSVKVVEKKMSYFSDKDTDFLTLSLEQVQLEDAHPWSSNRVVKNLDSVSPLGFSYGNVTEEIGRSLESWRFSNLNTPASYFNHHHSNDAKDSQVQFDYEMAMLLSEQMQLEDVRLRSSRREVEKFQDVSSSDINYGYGAEIKNVERSRESRKISNINKPDENSRGYISRNPSIGKSQVQQDYELALEIGEELHQKDQNLWPSEKKIDNLGDTTPSSTKHSRQNECNGCRELFGQDELISVGCPEVHVFCKICLKTMFRLSISKERPFPPSCCKKPIAFPLIAKHFTPTEVKQFLDAELEYQTKDKVYCYRPECGQFIPRKELDGDKAKCLLCHHQTCVKCKKAAHRGDCAADEDMQRLRALADQNKWVRCFQCQSIVDRSEGCNHMTCRCGAEFCYKCSRRWKTCSCEEFQFDIIQDFQPFHIQNIQHRPVHNLQNFHNFHNFENLYNFQNTQDPQNPHDQDFFQNWNLNNFQRF
ncbi:hypothetical protein OnM2_026002 [Erysiphe neolycopersici]|uniref:RBR-type E3 ubiquitin transferase n=1 Tax=Erysiphe neolycopersici TaxID=212602 RepID=A0A420I0S0_9PEZI|nr:hypothetical protein OnM2_026002 [Erysiphe neolycopersici]